MSLQFGVNIPVPVGWNSVSLFVSTIEQANRSVSLLGFDNQPASATCQAAWLWNTSLENRNMSDCGLLALRTHFNSPIHSAEMLLS